jgi:hypothetical protein
LGLHLNDPFYSILYYTGGLQSGMLTMWGLGKLGTLENTVYLTIIQLAAICIKN